MELPKLSIWPPSQQHDPIFYDATSRTSSATKRRMIWRKLSASLKRTAMHSSAQARQQIRNPKQAGCLRTEKDALRDSHPIGRVVTFRAIPASPHCEEDGALVTLPTSTTPLCLDLSDTGHSSTNDMPSSRNFKSSTRRNQHSFIGNDGLGILIEITRPAAQGHDQADMRYTASSRSGQLAHDTSSDPVIPPVTVRDIFMRTIIAAQQRRQKSESTFERGGATSGHERPLTPMQTRELLQALEDVTRTSGAAAMSEPKQRSVAVCVVCSAPKLRPSAVERGIITDDSTTDSRDIADPERIDKVTPYIVEVVSRCPSLATDTKNAFEQHVAATGSAGSSMECCGGYVCRICLRQTIRDGIQNSWWLDLPLRDRDRRRDDGWIRCPAPSCAEVLPLNSSNISQQLERLGVQDVTQLTSMFDQAKELRTALRAMSPRPTEKEIQRGLKMHTKLVKLGCAWPLLGAKNHELMATPELGRTSEPVTRSGVKVERVSVDYPNRKVANTGTDDDRISVNKTRRVQIPMFTHSLRLPRVRKECAICAEIYHDFAPGSILSRLEDGENKTQVAQAVAEHSESNKVPWRKATLEYPGDWMWQIFAFSPAHILPECFTSISSNQGHTNGALQETCKNCLSRSIKAQLDLLGTRVAERGVSCPLPHGDHSGGHSLTFEEVRRLANSEVFARYDRLMTLAAVCNDEGFRWCLRPGCESGAVYDIPGRTLLALPTGGSNQVYDNDRVIGQNGHALITSTTPTTSSSPLPPLPLPPRTSSANIPRPLIAQKHSHQEPSNEAQRTPTSTENYITCHACRFTMCHTCQTPWHSGLTCAQAHALRQHGDPQPLRTQSWLDAHTKRCPGAGCGFALQKGEGCFHMTCPSCAAQFCWECLADWAGIVVEGRFRREGHAEGCYFRGENAVPPTQIMGRTVERGLRRTRGLFNRT